ncbi:hypothetical protein ACHAXS_012669 [Conticribra weissflogii]
MSSSSASSSSDSDDGSIMPIDKTHQSSTPQTAESGKKRKLSIKVQVTKNNPEYDPVVVSFPRGVPSSLADEGSSNSTNNNDKISFMYSKLKANSSRGKRLIGQDASETCTYTATASGRGHDGRLTKLHVVVYDKKLSTWKVIPTAEKGTVFALDQAVVDYVPNVMDGGMGIGGGNASGSGAMKASERVQLLVESFGSKKKQRVMASRAANMVNINSVVGAGNAMMNSVQSQGDKISEGNKEAMVKDGKDFGALSANEIALMQARRALLPPFDDKADAPHKIYDAQQIAGPESWKRCSQVVDKILKKSQANNTDFIEDLLGNKDNVPQSVMTLISSINPNKRGNSYRLKAAFFLYLVMRFHSKISKRGFITGKTLDDCLNVIRLPHEVGTHLFEIFTTRMEGGKEDGYISSRNLTDKRLMYLLILYVIASDASKEMKLSSINQFCKDIKLDDKKAAMLLREAGFAVKKSGTGDWGCALSAPLKFPPPKRGKRS